jgi:hypothetical protein
MIKMMLGAFDIGSPPLVLSRVLDDHPFTVDRVWSVSVNRA